MPRREWLVVLAIFVVVLGLFLWSPVTVTGDSKYTLLLTESLFCKGSFMLDGYGIPRHPPKPFGAAAYDGDIYQIEIADGHFYYFFPPGSSILSAPFVLVGKLFGQSVVRPDGSYDFDQEIREQLVIASLLMAGLAVTFYFTARLLLPANWSAVVALGGVLGTQVWSTASRGLGQHTWSVALLGFAVLLLLAHETGRYKLPASVFASVLSWAYFVRPTNGLFIVGATVYLLLCHREGWWRYALTGAAWFTAFALYAWMHFGRLLPGYYMGSKLSTGQLPEALLGNLVSPSRGLLLFVPVVIFLVYLLCRFWRYCPHRRLLGLGAGISLCHYVLVSSSRPWFGGWCYGPRYTTDLVPWLVLTAVLGLAAALRRRSGASLPARPLAWRATLTAGGILLGLSVFINAHGAIDIATRDWNKIPVKIDDDRNRVWDWRNPQMLAGLWKFTPAIFPRAATGRRIAFAKEGGRVFQFTGWSASEDAWCWSNAHNATLIFALDNPPPARLRLCFGVYLNPPRLTQQWLKIRLNGRTLISLTATDSEAHEYVLELPAERLAPRNTLTFELPDAAAPEALTGAPDPRLLGVALQWMQFEGSAR